MNGEIREPEPADDDIPVLTDIVVPGRLQFAKPDPGEAAHVPPEFVFDIDFEPKPEHGETRNDFPHGAPVLAPGPEGVGDAADRAFTDAPPSNDQFTELPLPWAGITPEPVRDASEPLIVAAFAKSAANRVDPPDADAQAEQAAREVGGKVMTIPMKIDDAILAGCLDRRSLYLRMKAARKA